MHAVKGLPEGSVPSTNSTMEDVFQIVSPRRRLNVAGLESGARIVAAVVMKSYISRHSSRNVFKVCILLSTLSISSISPGHHESSNWSICDSFHPASCVRLPFRLTRLKIYSFTTFNLCPSYSFLAF